MFCDWVIYNKVTYWTWMSTFYYPQVDQNWQDIMFTLFIYFILFVIFFGVQFLLEKEAGDECFHLWFWVFQNFEFDERGVKLVHWGRKLHAGLGIEPSTSVHHANQVLLQAGLLNDNLFGKLKIRIKIFNKLPDQNIIISWFI